MTSAPQRITFNYVLAVLLLAGTAVALQTAKSRGAFQLVKKASPIRKPLQDLDRACVRPIEVLTAPQLAPETVEELGTSEYVEWALQVPRQRIPCKAMRLFVTYYTGVQDQVPHVPEECLAQGAFSPDTDKTLEMDLKQLGRRVSIRRLSFFPPQQTTGRVYVYYTICINGDYYAGRESARLRMANPHESHLYYSKVELSFEGLDQGGVASVDQYANGVLDQVLTELVRSHWPQLGSGRGGEPEGAGR